MVDHAGSTSPPGARVVATGRREAYPVRRAFGWILLVGFGSVFVLVVLTTLLSGVLVGIGLATGATGLVSDAGVALLGFAVVLLVTGGFTLVGYGAVREVRELDRLRLVIDDAGIARERPPPRVVLPWDRIRHAVVTSGRRGTRRLLVDDATGPEARPEDAGGSVGAIIGRGRRRYVLDIPIDLLDVPADDLVHAIRRHSRHRLPDM